MAFGKAILSGGTDKMSVKQYVKALLPNRVLEMIHGAKARRIARKLEGLSTQQVFSEIYTSGMWGKSADPNQPFYSGSGSHDETVVQGYVDSVTAILRNRPSKLNLVDLGCGDFSVGSRIRPFCNDYIACDIVPQLIEFNRQKFEGSGVDFRIVNLVTDPLPQGDVVVIRQVLQHLSNEQIAQVIPKLYNSFDSLILAEHLPKTEEYTPNLDKPAGPDIRTAFNSGIVLTQAPFNLKALEETVIHEAEQGNGIIRTTLYRLK
jgi:hypothetical protein